jgi:hypothetical protein
MVIVAVLLLFPFLVTVKVVVLWLGGVAVPLIVKVAPAVIV